MQGLSAEIDGMWAIETKSHMAVMRLSNEEKEGDLFANRTLCRVVLGRPRSDVVMGTDGF